MKCGAKLIMRPPPVLFMETIFGIRCRLHFTPWSPLILFGWLTRKREAMGT
ncbi:uncharacterized protein G2W53_019903 [Senna tora]|uniref:Uncharacterized protein n=1 Tax=Senna tora TaxID=362788 RepID=A0A834WS57_9FABA|nr:uncharacterized protein G2W53_019903 [Senna tora]